MGGIGRVAVPVGIAALSGAAAVGHLVINGSFPTMFLLHIVGMTLAFVAIGPIAALVKKAPGNTMLHFFVAATSSWPAYMICRRQYVDGLTHGFCVTILRCVCYCCA